MYTLSEPTTQTLEVKQSKFIAHLIPYTTYEETLQQLQQQHPKARHFVTAYRYLNEYDQIVEHSSDDGEPKGTSGKPSLMVLQGQDLIDVAVIVVRYFGGTKLGTGGLVRAYSDAVNLAVESATLIRYEKQITQEIEIAYEHIRLVEYACEQHEVEIVDKEFSSNVRFTILGSEENIEALIHRLPL